MLETHLKSAITQQRLRSGPAAGHIDEFADWLQLNGYTPISIEYRLQALARWTDWMTTMGLSSQDWLEAFEQYRSLALKPPKPLRCSVGATKDSVTAASLFIRFLQESGYIQRKAPPPSNRDLWPIAGEFRKWMLEQRGVTESTLDTYERTLVRLLKALGNDSRAYSAKTLRTFVLDQTGSFGIWHAKAVCVATRTFCRFLSATGRCAPGLEYGIPSFPSLQQSSVPRFIDADAIEKLVDSCETYRFGIRDKAVLLLLARLGLRASEVANLSFDNIDWSNGTITVSGKGRRQELLPLTSRILCDVRCNEQESKHQIVVRIC